MTKKFSFYNLNNKIMKRLTKFLLLLCSVALITSCDDNKPITGPFVFFNHYLEYVNISFDDGFYLEFDGDLDASQESRIIDGVEYFSLYKYDNNTNYITVTYANHTNSLISVYDLRKKAIFNTCDFEIDEDHTYVANTSTFFQVYTVKVGSKVVYQNDNAISDTYWYENIDNYENGLNKVINLTLNSSLEIEKEDFVMTNSYGF